MSMYNKSYNYNLLDVEKPCIKPIMKEYGHQSNVSASPSRYKTKKSSYLSRPVEADNCNQNNLDYPLNSRRYKPAASFPDVAAGRYRYKSYDYLPAANASKLNRSRTDHMVRGDVYNDCSESGEEVLQRDEHDSRYHRPRLLKQFSSNEDLDNSKNYEYEQRYSSDDSSTRPFRDRQTTKLYHSTVHGDCARDSCLDGAASHRHPRWAGCEPKPKFNGAPPGTTGASPACKGRNRNPGYENNNRNSVDYSPRKFLNRSYSDHRRYMPPGDNYAISHRDVDNKNLISLRSTYRKNENVPHSGTRLEHNRKQLDKLCSGGGGGRVDRNELGCTRNVNNRAVLEPPSSGGRPLKQQCQTSYTSRSVAPTSRYSVNKVNLPPSPKYPQSGSARKCSHERPLNRYDDVRDDSYRYGTPRRESDRHYRDQFSDNDTCFFDRSKNANNDCSGGPGGLDTGSRAAAHIRTAVAQGQQPGEASELSRSDEDEEERPEESSSSLAVSAGDNVGPQMPTSFSSPRLQHVRQRRRHIHNHYDPQQKAAEKTYLPKYQGHRHQPTPGRPKVRPKSQHRAPQRRPNTHYKHH